MQTGESMFKNILLLLVSIAFILSVFEGGVRLVGSSYAFRPQNLFFIKDDPELGWKNKKDTEGIHRLTPDKQVAIKINGKGLRGREFPYEKPEGVKRIIVLGDSVAFGHGLEEQDSLPSVLQQRLPEGYEVINAGVTGYGTDQEYLFYEKELSKYQFDLLIVVLSSGDISDNSCSVRNSSNKPYFRLEGGELKLFNVPVPENVPVEEAFFRDKPVRRFLFKNSALFRFVFYRLTDLDRLHEMAVEEMELQEGLEVSEAIVRAFKEDCNDRGCSLLFLFLPNEDVLGNLPHAHAGMLTFLKRAGVPYMDLWEPFSSRAEEGIYQDDDPIHPNRKGNEIIVEEILKTTGF
jgi:lysophospholipase L1-like esterase